MVKQCHEGLNELVFAAVMRGSTMILTSVGSCQTGNVADGQSCWAFRCQNNKSRTPPSVTRLSFLRAEDTPQKTYD